jgi:4-amino-4-deoxy-L-arabinose transferase-like glycosyltransferase
VAAAVGSNRASGYQLATGKPVMAIGGFNGTDPAPTLAEFEKLVSEGKIHYFIAGGAGGGPGGTAVSSTSSQITTWVLSHFTAQTLGGTTVYDLTAVPLSP